MIAKVSFLLFYVNNINKNAKEKGVYNLETSNLNNSFFYAFATKEEAETLFENTIIKDRTQADEITKCFDDIVKKAEEV